MSGFWYKGFRKSIVFILVVAFLSTSINWPIQPIAWAEEIESQASSVTDNADIQAADLKEGVSDDAITAITTDKLDISKSEKLMDQSDEFTNIYRNPDGTNTAVFYLAPVNYKDETGELKEIKNNIIAEDDAARQAEGFQYKNEDGPVEIKLPDNLVSDTPVQVTYGDHTISMLPIYPSGKLSTNINAAPSPTASTSPSPSPTPSATPSPSASPSPSLSASPSPSPSESVAPSPSTSVAPSESPSAPPIESASPSTDSVSTVSTNLTGGLRVEPLKAANSPKEYIPVVESVQPDTATDTLDQTAAVTDQPQIDSLGPAGIPDEYKAQPEKQIFDEKDREVAFKNDGDKNTAIQRGKAVEKTTALNYLSNFDRAVSIKYTPTSTGLKEEIILNQYTGQNSFDFLLSTGSLVPEMAEDNSIQLKDPATGTIVATIPTGTMYDSFTGEVGDQNETHVSHDIAYSISPMENPGEYKLTLTVDDAFLKNESTVYPVYIDPSVIDFTYSSQVWDTNYRSDYPSTDCSGWAEMRLGHDGASSYEVGYIYYRNLVSYLQGNTINSAYMHAVEIRNWNVQPYPYDVAVYRCTTGATPPYDWYHQPGIDGSSPWAYIQRNTNNQDYVFDLTALTRAWANHTYENLGLTLSFVNQQLYQYRDFKTVDSGDWNAMRLEVNYTDATAPNPPPSFTANPNFSFNGTTASVTVNWSPATDLPPQGASGIRNYELTYAGAPTTWAAPSNANSFPFSNLNDSATYTFGIRVWDNAGNYCNWVWLNPYTIPDKTKPTVPTSFTISPNGWTKEKESEIKWSGITDPESHLWKVEYQIDSTSEAGWLDTASTTPASGSKKINTLALSNGPHTIYLRAKDRSITNSVEYINVSDVVSIKYYKDTIPPEVALHPPGNLFSDTGSVTINASVAKNDEFSNLDRWELSYGLGTEPSKYTVLTSGGGQSSTQNISYAWDTSGLVNNQMYTLKLTANDAAGNSREKLAYVLYAKDGVNKESGLQIDQPVFGDDSTTDGFEPEDGTVDSNVISSEETTVQFSRKDDGTTNGLADSKLYVNNELADTNPAGTGLTFNAAAYDEETDSWKYPEGSIAFLYAQARDTATKQELYSTNTYSSTMSDNFLDLSGVAAVDVESDGNAIRLKRNGSVYSTEGNFQSIKKEFAGDINYVDLTTNQTVPAGCSIEYYISFDGGNTWSAKDDFKPITTDSSAMPNYANRYYCTAAKGDSYIIKAVLKGTGSATPSIDSWAVDARYTAYATAILVNNDFPKDTRGIVNLSKTRHDEDAECIKLDKIDPIYGGYYPTGTVQSTLRNTSNDAIAACLEVDEKKPMPDGTNISYEISTNGGVKWDAITPGSASNIDDWQDITPGKNVVIRAILTSTDGTNTPELNSWKLSIKEKIAGQSKVIKLVDEPWNLSTLTGANYMTLLRWEASANEGVTYNVYRSKTPYFAPSEENQVAHDLVETSWSDYNLDYGQVFYYKVTAVRQIGGHARESLPSNEAFAYVAGANEVNKKLGLQDYWGYSGFNTGSGTGYVNVANGNVVYSTTDIVASDPFLAMVMRRTYNSTADTKTPMGYGWDYSFNTCLLKDRDESMILKDGDGSFHVFAKNATGYDDAVGSFMRLKYDAGSDEYRVTRKDNVTYHFNAQSMKLKSFTDSNKNALLFAYDERGNLKTVTDNIGETITFDYDYDKTHELENNPDFIYENYHPDMLYGVTWSDGSSASITYTYGYTRDDKLAKAGTTLDGFPYQEQFSYTNGKLSAITDPKNNQTGLTYAGGAPGKLQQIKDASGDTYTFGYGADNTSITSNYGVSVGYGYDANGLVTRKTDALGNSISYTYNADYLLTGMSCSNYVNGGTTPQTLSYSYAYDTNGNILSVSGPGGTQSTFGGYNSLNKPTSMTVNKDTATTLNTGYTYDANGNLLTTKDPLNKTTTNQYAALVLSDGITSGHAGFLTQVTDPNNKVTKYAYDTKGRVMNVKVSNNGADERTTSYDYAYNADGYFMRMTVTDAMGNAAKTYYDMLGRKMQATYPDGKFERWEYDMSGNVVKATDRSGAETRYTFDALSRPTGAVYPDGSTNTIKYLKWDSDNNGTNDADKVTKTDGAGVVGNEYYDKAGRLVKKSVVSNQGELVSAQYSYDLLGNCTQVTDNAGRVSQAQYNELGQQTKTVVDPYGASKSENSVSYDLLGNKLSVTDGEGKATSYAYDNGSRLSTVIQTVGSTPITTSYTYDLQEGGYIKNSVTDANGHVTQTWFDQMGNKKTDYNQGDAGNGTVMQTAYTYNLNNQADVITRNDGTKVKNTYNSLGQLTRVDYYDAGAGTGADSNTYLTYEYNINGKKIKETACDRGGEVQVTNYVYDSMGRVIQTQQGTATVFQTVSYSYNGADQVTMVSYTKDGTVRQIGYVYDGYGRTDRITVQLGGGSVQTVRQYVYKANGDLDYTRDYREFDTTGQGYIDTAYTLNGAGMTTNITSTDYQNSGATGVVKESYAMQYDRRGYITSETDTTNYGSSSTTSKSYTYDDIGRLTQATIGSKTNNYTYDSVGNRLTKNSDTYHYNEFNQLTSISGGKNESYTYDGRGNQTGKGIDTYAYNLMDQLTRANVHVWQGVSGYGYDKVYSEVNAYNAAGQRVKQTLLEDNVDYGAVTKYYYTGSDLLYTTNQFNNLLTESVLDLNGGIVASKRFIDEAGAHSEKYYFYHTDIRGSTTNIIKPDGSKVTGYEYDEFGNIESQTGSTKFLNEVTFTGSVYDKTTGLQYMNARFYQPATGRFLSQDSYTGNPYNPWTQHLYTYCGNNPTNMVDPTGHFANILIGAAIGFVGGLIAWGTTHGDQGWGSGDFWATVGISAGIGALAGATFGASLAVTGAIGATGASMAITGVGVYGASGLMAMGQNAVETGVTKGYDKINPVDLTISGAIGAGTAFTGDVVSSTVSKVASKVVAKAVSSSGGKNIVGSAYNEIKPTQSEINKEIVEQYANKLKAGQSIKPVDVLDVSGKGRYILDGHHRYVASQLTGIPVPLRLVQGEGPIGYPDWSYTEYVSWNGFDWTH